LASSENELEEINSKVTHAAGTPELLEQRELHSTIRRICRVALAPHKRLPLEILPEIVSFYGYTGVTLPPPPTEINDFTIHWDLTRVCSLWRNVIFDTPGFWVTFHVRRFHDQYRSLYQQAFDRSTSSPIALHCHQFCKGSRNDLSHTIFPNSQRIKMLFLTLEVPDCPDFLTHPPGSFDALELIQVDLSFFRASSFPVVKSTVLEDACSLRTVILEHVRGYPGVTYLTFNHLRIPWAQLTQVFLRDIYVSVSTAHLMLSQCESLVNCVLFVGLENIPPHPLQHNSIVVPNLQHLDVYCMDGTSPEFLQPLVMPSLKKLLFNVSESWPGAALLSFIRRSRCSFERWKSYAEIPFDDLEVLLSELSSVTSIMINPEGGILIPTIDKIGEGKLLPRIKHLECSVALENIKPLLDMVDTLWFDCDSKLPGTGLTPATIHVNDDEDVDDLFAQVEALQQHYESEGKAISIQVGGI
jgi:hypothetical protein